VPIPDETLDLRLRDASEADAALLREWRNDPEVRAASRNRGEVGAAEHAAWLAAVLADRDRMLLICELAGDPVGQVRLDRIAGRRYEISLSLAAGARGRGLAARFIAKGVERLREKVPGAAVEAHVREANDRSLTAFRRAGFALTGESDGFLVLRSGEGAR
jgi:UDP-2,4-diacetamido-2,4,6-trideoxy-beta-L-altropyranose hydrolase